MQNVVEILAVQTNPRAIIPCVRIFKGLYIGSKDYAAPFTLDMQFNYFSGGEPKQVKNTAVLSTATVESEIDPRNLDIHPPDVSIPAAVDSGTNMTVIIKVFINDASGARVGVGDAQTAVFPIA